MGRLRLSRPLIVTIAAVPLLAIVGVAVWLASRGTPATTAGCSSFGTSYARSYDASAAKDGNPIRIVSACCAPTSTPQVSSCLLTVGELGVRGYGCERIDLDAAGPVSDGKHETCPKT